MLGRLNRESGGSDNVTLLVDANPLSRREVVDGRRRAPGLAFAEKELEGRLLERLATRDAGRVKRMLSESHGTRHQSSRSWGGGQLGSGCQVIHSSV